MLPRGIEEFALGKNPNAANYLSLLPTLATFGGPAQDRYTKVITLLMENTNASKVWRESRF
jgi:hypothetical protein